jgi:hypothetical protein
MYKKNICNFPYPPIGRKTFYIETNGSKFSPLTLGIMSMGLLMGLAYASIRSTEVLHLTHGYVVLHAAAFLYKIIKINVVDMMRYEKGKNDASNSLLSLSTYEILVDFLFN